MSESIYLIYKHTSPSGKSYIGLTNNYEQRCMQHRTTSGCKAFNAAVKKYGWDNFTHDILVDHITLNEANILEEHYINEHNTLYPQGYNLKTGGGAGRHTDITKARMSASHIGMTTSNETKAKMSVAHTGKVKTSEHLAKISAAKKGKLFSVEHKAKLSAARIGKTCSDETKAKISAATKGRVLSDGHKAILLASNKGRVSSLKGTTRSDETKSKISAAKKGKMTLESKAKTRAGRFNVSYETALQYFIDKETNNQ